MHKNDQNKSFHEKMDAKQNYIYSILSVLSQKRRKKIPCPDPEDLAAFSEGMLSRRQRNKIMAHFNECSSCRRNWIMLESTLAEMAPAKETRIAGLIHKLKQIKPYHAFTGGGLSFALATCLLLLFFIPWQNDLDKMISNSYGYLTPSDKARYNSFTTRGTDLDATVPLSKAAAAYNAGLKAGKAKLSGKPDSSDEPVFDEDWHSLLFSMGKWVVLLQCACISTEPASNAFWAEQEAISYKLRDGLKKAGKTEATTRPIPETVTILKTAIRQIMETGNIADGCEEIVLAIERFEKQL